MEKYCAIKNKTKPFTHQLTIDGTAALVRLCILMPRVQSITGTKCLERSLQCKNTNFIHNSRSTTSAGNLKRNVKLKIRVYRHPNFMNFTSQNSAKPLLTERNCNNNKVIDKTVWCNNIFSKLTSVIVVTASVVMCYYWKYVNNNIIV